MSAIHPTHPLGIHLQDDRHFVGTLHLIGCQSEDNLVPSPPPYDASMQASFKEVAIENVHEAFYDSKSQSVAKWDTLITACEEATVKLKASSVDLDQNWFKTHLLKEEKAVVQQQLKAGLAQVQLVHEAAQALCYEETPTHLLTLEAALKGLEAAKPAGSTSYASPNPSDPIQNERINSWQRLIQNYLGPLALTGWGLIVQSGILSSDTAKRIPLVGGVIGLCLKIKDSIDTCIEQAKTEDQAGLIAVCESLVETFMNADRIGKAVQETLAARKQQEESLEFIKTARREQDAYFQEQASYNEKINSDFQKFGSHLQEMKVMTDKLNSIDAKKFEVATLESRLTKLEEDNKFIKQGIERLLQQSNAPSSSTQHTAVENPA